MKHLFILNPAAGQRDRTAEFTKAIQTHCAGLDYEIAVSRHPGDCAVIARRAASTGQELRIYACGVDGTLNEVANGVVGRANVSITHYCGGSGNDFVRAFSEPEAFGSLPRLLDCEETEFDLIQCGDHYALNICSIGLDARIGTSISKYKRLPLVTGPGAYILSLIANLLKGIHEHYRITIDGEVFDGRYTLVCIANGRWYGGSFNPCPDAEPDDGMLEVLVVKPVNLLQVAMVIGKYQKGQYADYPQLISHYRTRQVTVSCGEDSVVNLDGEALRSREVTFRISGEKLRFFYPRGLSYRMRERKTEEACAI